MQNTYHDTLNLGLHQINGDTLQLAQLKTNLDHNRKLAGNLNHLQINTKTHSFTAPPYIIIGDLSDGEQGTCLLHHNEITNIGFMDANWEPIWVPLSNINSIEVFEAYLLKMR